MEKRPHHRQMKYPNNIGTFSEADTLCEFEPALNRHYIGTPNATNKRMISGKSLGTLSSKVPPPLPEASSASDIYTKKIASFKRKLKTLKGISTSSRDKSIDSSGSLEKKQDDKNIFGLQNDKFSTRSPNNTTTDPNSFDIASIKNPFYDTSSPTVPTFNIPKNDMSLPIRKQARENQCCICNLLLDTFYNLQENERIIELKCDHMVHEECLSMDLELSLSLQNVALTDKRVLVHYLPACSLCTDEKTIPKSDNVLTELFTKMLTLHLTNPNITMNSSTLSIPSPSTPTYYENPKFMSSNSLPFTPPNHDSAVNIITHDLQKLLSADEYGGSKPNNKNEVDFGGRINIDRMKSKKLSPYKKHSKRPSRGSHASGASAIISSVQKHKDNVEELAELSNRSLAQKFVSELLILSTQKTIEAYDDANFILCEDFIKSLGQLKLIDKLTFMDSHRNVALDDCYCYLFDHVLLAFTLTEGKFYLISINRLTNIEPFETNSIVVKASRNTNQFHKLTFTTASLRDKWNAIMSTSTYDKTTPITSTLDYNEFDHLIVNETEDLETIGTLQSFIGDDGYRRLPTGVCPRFYEGTINSLVFKEKPTKAIIVLNQTHYIPHSSVSLKNMIASLSLIGIDILLILAASSKITMDTEVIGSYELEKKDFKMNGEQILGKIDEFQTLLKSGTRSSNSRTVASIVKHYVSNAGIYDSIINMFISNATLKHVENVFMLNQILIEVGLDSVNRSNRSDVDDLASWEDIMEVICSHCGLEFDESDFYDSSDDGSDSDDGDGDDDDDDVRSEHIPLRMKLGIRQT